MRVRRKAIPKDGGTKVRVLSIPSIRDRVVQGALKLILEPIFEADFQPGSYGYRPKRTAPILRAGAAQNGARRITVRADRRHEDDRRVEVAVEGPFGFRQNRIA